MSDLIVRAALAYAERLNWPVFPVNIRKQPAVPEPGHKLATTDAGQLRAWGPRFAARGAGVAVYLAAAGLVAVDVDVRYAGDEALDLLEHQHGKIPATVVSLTGGGGFHYLLKSPDGVRWRRELGRREHPDKPTGIDLKHEGYVVLPPSPHKSGRAYAWELSSHPLEVPVADPPAWLLSMGTMLGPCRAPAPATGPAASSLLGLAFRNAGLVLASLANNGTFGERLGVTCPWRKAHGCSGGVTQTLVFAPTAEHPDGRFWCCHNSCRAFTTNDALEVLPVDAVRAAAAELVDLAVERAAIAGEAAA